MPFDLFDQSRNEILDAKNYLDFKQQLVKSDCRLCALSSTRTHIVVDRGNPEAKVVIIGEGPGENEDLKGQAFVGRAGQLLDRLMKDVGFDTNKESLIINVVKCRPPENRQPVKAEVDACFPFLKKQLDLVKPRAILLLGATALKHVLPEKEVASMKSQVGQFFADARYPGAMLMVLYHPAFLLRDPRKQPEMSSHLKRFKEWLDTNEI